MLYASGMANCYLCGCTTNGRQLRRRVKTGEFVRRRYPTTSVSHIQVSYGMRIVCPLCAKRLDRWELRLAWMGHASMLVALAGLVLGVLALQWLP